MRRSLCSSDFLSVPRVRCLGLLSLGLVRYSLWSSYTPTFANKSSSNYPILGVPSASLLGPWLVITPLFPNKTSVFPPVAPWLSLPHPPRSFILQTLAYPISLPEYPQPNPASSSRPSSSSLLPSLSGAEEALQGGWMFGCYLRSICFAETPRKGEGTPWRYWFHN